MVSAADSELAFFLDPPSNVCGCTFKQVANVVLHGRRKSMKRYSDRLRLKILNSGFLRYWVPLRLRSIGGSKPNLDHDRPWYAGAGPNLRRFACSTMMLHR